MYSPFSKSLIAALIPRMVRELLLLPPPPASRRIAAGKILMTITHAPIRLCSASCVAPSSSLAASRWCSVVAACKSPMHLTYSLITFSRSLKGTVSSSGFMHGCLKVSSSASMFAAHISEVLLALRICCVLSSGSTFAYRRAVRIPVRC
jgi:hypothetical protein